MAKMGAGAMKVSPVALQSANERARVAPLPLGTLTFKVGILSAEPAATPSSTAGVTLGSIMPEGFITYTDVMPSADSA